MAFVNYNNKEITAKIVYYGPALSGKTTSLQYVFKSGEYKKKGKLITLDTDGDRTLFFDFLPVEIGKVGDYSIKMQLYTVPGQVAYNTTRKLVLQGADGVVFVADSQLVMREKNIESFKNLKENLKANNIVYAETPLIFQYNKRDLKETVPVDMLDKDLNHENKAYFPTIGTTGENILEALHAMMKMVIIHLKNKLTIFQNNKPLFKEDKSAVPKDKTVLFSRDEVTDSIVKKRKIKNKPGVAADKKVNIAKENTGTDTDAGKDTEKEEIFELSTSMADDSEPLTTNAYRKEDDIFDLSDESRVEYSGEELEVPEVILKDELGDDEKETRAVDLAQVERKKETKKVRQVGTRQAGIAKEYQLKREDVLAESPAAPIPGDAGTIDANVPIHIKIPEDKDEIKINLNLQIVIKKKK